MTLRSWISSCPVLSQEPTEDMVRIEPCLPESWAITAIPRRFGTPCRLPRIGGLIIVSLKMIFPELTPIPPASIMSFGTDRRVRWKVPASEAEIFE